MRADFKMVGRPEFHFKLRIIVPIVTRNSASFITFREYCWRLDTLLCIIEIYNWTRAFS